MAGAFVVAPYVQLLDANGVPLAGGLVYTYAAGTGTPLPLYSDPDLNVVHQLSNPIQLDSAGRFAAYALNVPYKVVVLKSDLSTWWTQDNYWIASPSNSGGGGSTGGFPDWMTALVF